MVIINPNQGMKGSMMKPREYFTSPENILQKQYEALRAFYLDNLSATQTAEKFGYTLSSLYSLIRDFKKTLAKEKYEIPFFATRKTGRKQKDTTGEIKQLIISLRKKYLSVPDIKSVMDSLNCNISEKYIYNVITNDGFSRLPRRPIQVKKQACSTVRLDAPKSVALDYATETFVSQNSLGINCLLPYIQKYGIIKLIENSNYPETKALNKIASILSFVALKLSNTRRYTTDDAWCMDRGLGLFAGLNVLPKAAWFTSYSHRITRQMNISFLKSLHKIWLNCGFLSDTTNLDFTTIPYWGDDSHLENNWSGKRNKGIASILAVIGQDPDSGIITYGDINIRHDNESGVVLEFLDFYKKQGHDNLRYLVFDSKFTTYENLARIEQDVKFITIRRRGKNIVEKLDNLPSNEWKKVRVMKADGKGRTLKVNDSIIKLRDYGKELRQIAITGHGKIKPALIITNEFEKSLEKIIRKYARRWLVEKTISEQIEFFHLNNISSSMVIKVDFDLTMTVLTHNILRLLAMELPGYSHNTAQTLFDKFLNNSGSVSINGNQITVKLRKKRNLPAILTAMTPFQGMTISSLGNLALRFEGETRS